MSLSAHEKIKPSSVIETILAAGKLLCCVLALRAAQWVFIEIQVIISCHKKLGLETQGVLQGHT